MWLDLGWKWGRHSLKMTLAWLQQGDKELYTDYDVAIQEDKAPSGVKESQALVDALYSMQYNSWLGFYLGGGFRSYENLAHDKHEDGKDGWIRSGIKMTFNPVDTKF
jgi:hypothetical protein